MQIIPLTQNPSATFDIDYMFPFILAGIDRHDVHSFYRQGIEPTQ